MRYCGGNAPQSAPAGDDEGSVGRGSPDQINRGARLQEFANLLARCTLLLTDSGGLQEEAPALHKPVLVMRSVTERPEAVRAGTVKLVGTKRKDIVAGVNELLTNPAVYAQMARAVNPYGDGTAAMRIRRILEEKYGSTGSSYGNATR